MNEYFVERLDDGIRKLLDVFPLDQGLVDWIASKVDIHDGTFYNTYAIVLGEALLSHRQLFEETPVPEEGWKQLMWDLGARHWQHAESDEDVDSMVHLKRAVEIYKAAYYTPVDGEYPMSFDQDVFDQDHATLLSVLSALETREE